jgi:hypothetical protein
MSYLLFITVESLRHTVFLTVRYHLLWEISLVALTLGKVSPRFLVPACRCVRGGQATLNKNVYAALCELSGGMSARSGEGVTSSP